MVTDLNFDGYEDFYLQGGTGTVNIPYYCYLWNPQGERFEPGYMIPNVEVDSEAQLIKSATDDGNGQHSVKYYRFDEANILHMVRYVEENQSPDAVFPTLDLTYCEPYYALPAVDEWDYGTRYGGALTERFVYWAGPSGRRPVRRSRLFPPPPPRRPRLPPSRQTRRSRRQRPPAPAHPRRPT